MAPACSNCLNITGLWPCSPVATRIGSIASRMRARPRTSSGEVGSSIQYGSNGASARIQPIASSTPQTWLASTAMGTCGPTASRASCHPPDVLRQLAPRPST